MYVEAWQFSLFAFATGVLVSIITLVLITALVYKRWLKAKEAEAEKQSNHDLMTKLCFVLLVKGLISVSDRDWMLDKIEFSEWKKNVENEINQEDSWFS